MSEAYKQVLLGEDNMDLMKKAAGGAMQHIKLKDGKLKMDSFTASAIMGVYDKVNPANKKKIETIINRGNKTSILKLQSMAMKAIKSGDELEHDGEELDEAKNYKIKNGKIHISKANFRKVHKDYKNSTKGKERMMALAPKSGATTSYEVVFEEVELDEKKIVLAKGMGKEVINDNGVIKLMKGGKVISDGDYDSGAGKFFMNIEGERGQVAFNEPEELLKIKEEVELDEAKYDLYHKDFSSAMQHATKMAKKLHGITIDPKEIDDKVATGPSKPGSGKTNKYRLKGDKGSIQVQVYNKGGSKPFELNMYKESFNLARFSDLNEWGEIEEESEYQGRKVTLNKPTKGDVKKSKVYVKNEKGNVVKVEFGDPNMEIKVDSPDRRRSFRARHNCENPGPKWKARYWSCKAW